MNIAFETYVVIPEDRYTESDIRHKKANWEAVVEGPRIYPLDTPIPFIVSGRGCYGYATVKEYTVNSATTTIRFTVTYVTDKSVTGVLYNAYRNAISSNGQAGYDESDDVLIPGIARKKRPSPRNNNGWNGSNDDRPLSSFFDD